MKDKVLRNQVYKLIFKLLLFLIPVGIGFILFFGHIFPKMILTSKDANVTKWNQFYQETINADLLILGSSTAFRGINPTILGKKLTKQKCYNYANIGMPLTNYPRLLHDYLLKNKPPEILIVSVDIFGLASSDNFGGVFWLLPSLADNSLMFNKLEQLKYVKYFKTYGYFLYRHLYFDLIKNPNTRSVENRGFEPQDLTWRGAGKMQKNSETLQLDTLKTANSFQKIKEYSKLSKVFIVISPLQKEYQEATKNKKQILDFIYKLCLKNNFSVIDLTQNAVCNDKKYFYNYSHLNLKGSTEISQFLGDTINQILIKELNKN